MTSNFITYPSIIDKTTNNVVVLIDAEISDIQDIGMFLKTSKKDHDVYLYRSNLNHHEWIKDIPADKILINNTSTLHYSNQERYGVGCVIENPLTYFRDYDER